MGQALAVYVPLFAFMLLPVWIPIIAVLCGMVSDAVRPREPSGARAAVEAAKRHSLERRTAPEAAPAVGRDRARPSVSPTTAPRAA